MATKDLKVNVIVNAKTKQLDDMFKRLNKMQTQVNRQAKAQDAVTRAVNKTNAAHKKTKTLIDSLTSKVHRLANAYLGVMAAKVAVTSSDTITSAENKLNHLNATTLGSAGYSTDASGAEVYSQATLNATQESMDKMYTSAQKTRMAYADMMKNVSKSMTLAGGAFGDNIDNAIRFQEIMAEAYTLSGSSAAEMSSSMYQMIQGLGSGVLQGDELRSVREGASMAYQAIEEYAKGIYGAEENLKDLASEGKITSDIVVAAILDNGEKMDEAFAKTEMTFAQAWTNMKNTALKSFEPVLQKLNDVLNSDVGQAIINGIGKAFQIVAGVLMLLFNAIETVFTFIQDNWGIIKNILLTIAIIIGGILLYNTTLWLISMASATAAAISKLGYLIASFIQLVSVQGLATTLAGWFGVTMNWALLGIIIVIAAVIIAVIWMSDSFTDACGNIVGAVFWLGATLWNIVVGVINAIIQFLWTYFVEPWIGIIEWVLNVFNDGFDSFGDRVKNLLGNIISWFLSLGKVVTTIIDAIFGSDWTGELSNLQDQILKWGKNEKAITLNREAPEVLHRISTQDAFNKGYGYGEKFGNWVGDKVGGIGSSISKALGVGDLPNIGLSTTDVTSNLDDINDNTSDMAGSMQLAEEDLEWLRKIARQEVVNKFTTAKISVTMNNDNTINNKGDLDGWAVSFRDILEEELNAVANGVYAV